MGYIGLGAPEVELELMFRVLRLMLACYIALQHGTMHCSL